MKIRSAGADLFHDDGQTDTAKPIFGFRNFTNAPKNTSQRSPVIRRRSKRTAFKIYPSKG